MDIIYTIQVNTYENNILPEADRIKDVFNSKSAFPMVNKKLEPPFVVISQ